MGYQSATFNVSFSLGTTLWTVELDYQMLMFLAFHINANPRTRIQILAAALHIYRTCDIFSLDMRFIH